MALLVTAITASTPRAGLQNSRGIVNGHVPIAQRVRFITDCITRLLL